MKESNCSLFAKEIINGVGGFKVWEDREFVVHTDRDIAIAEWVIRCLANPNNPLAEQALSEITNHRTEQGGKPLGMGNYIQKNTAMTRKEALEFLQNPIKDLTGLAEAIEVAIQVLEGGISDGPPILDGSEMIGEETVDEYLDRLVKKATPAWQGVDSQQFLDEVRGRNAGLEWKKGAPDMSGAYVIITRSMGAIELYDQYDPDDEYWDIDEVLWYIGPFPLAPQNDEE